LVDQEIVTIIGGGLAGTEAAWQIAQRGVRVKLWEMRPKKMTPAHQSGNLAELVCSNSLGADDVTKAPGLLKHEMRTLGSLMIESANAATVPAGAALAVDREVFAKVITEKIEAHPLIALVRDECTAIPDSGIVIVASGPLTSEALAADIARLSGSEHLYFWDAIAPIVTLESVDWGAAFRASRYNKHSPSDAPQTAASTVAELDAPPVEELGDYINCPMTKDEYYAFVDALSAAEMATLRDFEHQQFFEGCLPVEVLARRGRDSLAFGPMRPVGLRDPRTGRRPFAVVQLRQDNIAGTLYNLVGFQTNLKFPEQDRVLRMIPGLGQAEFVRYGQMHRNTFINSPTLLEPSMRFRARQTLFFAGQIVGVEGYVGNAATGLLAGLNAVRTLRGEPLLELPPTTMLGALCHYVTHAEPKHFQPMKANFGILPALDNPPRDKRRRAKLYSERAQSDLADYLKSGQPRRSATCEVADLRG
jgi:methylenetetrahydrofolate--tRNA-(uracil-5-)-methyltransferase